MPIGIGIGISPTVGRGGGAAPMMARGNRLGFAGDSRMLHMLDATQGFYSSNGLGTAVRGALGGQIDGKRSYVFAVGNTSAAHFRDTQVPSIITAYNANGLDAVLVLTTMNAIDDGGGWTAQNELDALQTGLDSLATAGVVVFLCDELPSASYSHDAVNDPIFHAALRDGIRAKSKPSVGRYILPTWNAAATAPDGFTPITNAYPAGDPVHGTTLLYTACAEASKSILTAALPAVTLTTVVGTGTGGTVSGTGASGSCWNNWVLNRYGGTGTTVGAIVSGHQKITLDGSDGLRSTFTSPNLIGSLVAGTDYIDAYMTGNISAGGNGTTRAMLSLLVNNAVTAFDDLTPYRDGGALSTDLLWDQAYRRTWRLPHAKLPTGATDVRLQLDILANSSVANDFEVTIDGYNVAAYAGTLTETVPVDYIFTNSEAAAFVARITAMPNNTRRALIDTYVGALKTASIWSKLDFLHVFAAHNSQAALLNWVANQYNCSLIDVPTFTADRGYLGDGVNDGLDTGVNAASLTLFTQNDGCIGAWAHQSGTAGLRIMGLLSGTNLQLGNNQGSTERLTRINSTTSETSDDNTTTGLLTASRAASGTGRSYRNGAGKVTGASTSSARASSHIVYLQNNGSAFHDGRISLGFAGGDLDDTAQTALYNASLAYLQGVGAA